MNKIVFSLCALLASASFVAAQQSAPPGGQEQSVSSDPVAALASGYTKKMENRVNNQVPMEKIYIQTDKPYYLAGEQLWYKLYLINAVTHEPSPVSKMVYVELVDERDSVKLRQLLMPIDGSFYGSFPIKTNYPEGNYRLRAYTSWMRNAGEEFHFSKPIHFSNNALNSIFTQAQFARRADGKVRVTLMFLNRQQKPYTQLKVEYALRQSENDQRVRNSLTNSQGKIVFDIDPNYKNGFKPYVEIRTSGDYGAYVKRHYLPNFNDALDIQFFPESGHLVNGVTSVVAFKAIDQNGYGTDVNGCVLNQKGDTVANFQSRHLGMGKLVIQPKAGEQYTAHVNSFAGLKKVPLPDALNEGVVLTIRAKKDAYMLTTVHNITAPAAQPAFLIAHTRGEVNYAGIIGRQKNSYIIQIPKTNFPSGIVSFTLFDTRGNVLGERLVFNKGADSLACELIANKHSYLSREKVVLDFIAKDNQGKPVQGDFSVSVTDSKDIIADPAAQNIMSYLLLSSDIKGNIEKAGLYFNNTLENSNEKLDALMMTQAWRRFDLSKVLSGADTTKMQHPVERGSEMTGMVRNIFEMRSKNAVMVMLAPSLNYFTTTTTDGKGRFTFSGYKNPDSTVYVISAKGAKGSKLVDPYVDPIIYPRFSYTEPTLFEAPKISRAYLQTATEKLFYEGGEQVINLDEVVITGRSSNSESASTYMADFTIGGEELESYTSGSIIDIISSLPGVSRISYSTISDDSEESSGTQTTLSFRGNTNPPLFVVNGMEASMDEVLSLNAAEVQRVEVVKNVAGAAMYGVRGSGGVVAITMKTGSSFTRDRQPPGIVIVKPLGAHQPKQFYSPNYAVPDSAKAALPDLRNTIFWGPVVKTDASGKAKIEFYTADRVNDYRVNIEGVGLNGKLGKLEGYLKRE